MPPTMPPASSRCRRLLFRGEEMSIDSFARLVVLDRIILLDDQWKRLRTYTNELFEFSGLNANEILERLQQEMNEDRRPMCWTQLAQEEITREELNRRLEGADAVITCWTSIPDEVVLANPQLRYVGFWTNLAQRRINLAMARRRGIYVTYIPDYGTDSVAEMTFAGMLAVSRKLMRSTKDTLRGKWPYELLKTGKHVPGADEIPQRMLKGKLLGIVGFGRIGQRVAEIAQAFHMRVQYYSRTRKPEWEDRGVEFTELRDLFAASDIVSIHLSPYAPEGIISAELIGCLKDGAIFVNTSAGRLVDQDALLCELARRRIYAYLDVYEGLPPRQQLKAISVTDNLFTYRAGWFTQEAVTYKGEMLLQKIEDFLSGTPGPPIWDEKGMLEDATEVPCGPRRACADEGQDS